MSSSPLSSSTVFCQTCSSEQTSSSIKQAYITPCCSSPICQRCVTLNPRLREYVPCLKCGDPRTSELSGSGIGSGAAAGRRLQAIIGAQGGEVVFEIGEDEDEDIVHDPDAVSNAPPKYEDIGYQGSSGYRAQAHPRSTSRSSLDRDTSSSRGSAHDGQQIPSEDFREEAQNARKDDNASSSPQETPNEADAQHPDRSEAEKERETVEVRHTVLKSDNLLAIARRYAADPHDLLTLNNLPPTTLSTNPRLLHTRKSIIISRRTVARDRDASSKDLQVQNTVTTGSEIDEAREKEKSLKRFQLITKSLEPGVGEAYLSLAQLDDEHDQNHEQEQGLFNDGSYGTKYENVRRRQIDHEDVGIEKEKDKPERIQVLGESSSNHHRETRALEAFFDDEQWETAVGASALKSYKAKQGRWNVVGVGATAGVGAIAKIGEEGSGSSSSRGGGGGGIWSVFGKVR
ncbi:hypothetical protein I317_06992 [Kwoniella heveanensis CBS 569]|nr:hypothetical protein I317_06992 [Kwoniella heveanensis CBS 569]